VPEQRKHKKEEKSADLKKDVLENVLEIEFFQNKKPRR
jgi:hypothetical protein